MKKLLIISFILLLTPLSLWSKNEVINKDLFFKAMVLEIVEEVRAVLPDGTETRQQKIKLIGLEGEFKNQEIIFDGLGDYDVIKKSFYSPGDKVMVLASYDDKGETHFYITDYVRSGSLWWLFFIFVVLLSLVGGWKGLRSVLSLVISFLVIIIFILPNILSGQNPLLITFFGSILILVFIIYLTEGFNKRSHASLISAFLSLILVVILARIFTGLAKLSGLAGEEISFLFVIGENVINFQGLLLAGIIIGALGVLDDVVISQTATVEQIAKANEKQSRKEVFKKAYRVGVSHISSMTNTLFLAYAGASLPLLLLFVSGQSAFVGWTQIINNEAIAVEIVRSLAGSIGLVLSIPISTAIAVWFFKNK